MMTRIATILLLLVFAFAQRAAADGKKPRHAAVSYVSADSVAIEDIFFSRIVSEFLGDDSTMRAKPVTLTKRERAKLIADSAAWHNDLAANLTLWGESSASALDNFYTAGRMFLVNPSHTYADLVERTLYNGVLAGLDSTESDDTRRTATQAVLDAMGMTYATAGNDLYVNLYYRNRAYIHNDSLDLVMMQNTSSPWKADVFFAFSFAPGPHYMRLHLRLPGWLHGEVAPGSRYAYEKTREYYQVSINGATSTVRARDGYIVIERMWQNDDVVRIASATPVRRVRDNAATDSRTFALQRGPIVYGYCGNDADAFFRPADAFGTLYDKDVLHTNLLTAKQYSAPAAGEAEPRACHLYPYYILKSAPGTERRVWLSEAR